MSAVEIRPARADDLPFLGAIDLSGGETFARYGQPLADISTAPSGHWRVVMDAGLLWILDYPASGPIGFLAAELVDGGLYVEQITVAIDHQQQGHGRRLMRTAIDWARAEGLAAVTLTTFRAIPWNKPFYASLGFVELAPADMPPHLTAHLANEASRGFQDRCAMRLAL
jgi:GNAT superfamily N-acetyltransferase